MSEDYQQEPSIDEKEAFLALESREHFPELTARLRLMTGSVSSEAALEERIMERAFAEGWVKPRPPLKRSGRTVAVVGSGMVGLVAAAQLNRQGHYVRVYESSGELGGLLRTGAQLDPELIQRRVRVLEAEGIEFVTNARVGTAIPWHELHAVSDALLIAIGTRRPLQLKVPGSGFGGIQDAAELLRGRFRVDAKTPELNRRRVLVLGKGPLSEQAVEFAQEQGALEVYHLAPLDTWNEQTTYFGPLEQRHSFGLGPGSRVQIKGFEGQGGWVCGVSMEVSTGVIHSPEDTFLPVDIVLHALGCSGPQTAELETQLGLELDVNGNVRASKNYQSSMPGIYYAGDANPDASALLWDISEGLRAGEIIHQDLAKLP